MRRAFELLERVEKRHDLGMGRSRFIDWCDRQEAALSAEQLNFVMFKLLRSAASAKKPAAFIMWATARPLGEWMSDADYESMKRLGGRRFSGSVQSADSVIGALRGLRLSTG